MGNKTSKTNKEFQAVIPYTPSSSRTHPKRKKATQPRRPTVAPALKKENSGISTDSTEDQDPLGNANSQRRIPLRSPSISEDVGWTPQNSNFDFGNTEGQNRRELIASCDSECSLITPFLYVGSFTVASSKEILNQNKITRIVNCSLCAVDNVFESDPAFTYLSLNMLDGRQDDISWFLCHVINFIEIARKEKCNVLVHCEKGISRSCSFAIAYIMWASGCQWKVAFDYVRERRKSCSPNTGFTCNLIEIDELLLGDSKRGPLMFRLAQHLPHDSNTPVLKLIRNSESRNLITPHFAYLNSDGVFIIRPSQGGVDQINILYIWQGRNATEGALKAACTLAELLLGIFSFATNIEIVTEGCESDVFKNYVEENNSQAIIDYDDLYEHDESKNVVTKLYAASSVTATSWSNELHIKVPSRLQVKDTIRGNVLQGVDKFLSNPSTIFVESSAFLKLSIPEFKMITSKVTPTSTPDKGHIIRSEKEDEVSHASAVTGGLVLPSVNEGGTRDEPNSVQRELNFENAIAKDKIDMTVTTPFNPAPKENLLSIGLQIPTFQVESEQNENQTKPEINVASPSQAISRAKPSLFQCFTSSDNSVLWQHMGIYDDDDLLEENFMLLLCPEAPHHLWKGSAFELHQMAVVNSVTKFEELGDKDDGAEKIKKINEEDVEVEKMLKYAMDVVNVGEVPMTSDELQAIFALKDNIRFHQQNCESEEWWDAFNNGM